MKNKNAAFFVLCFSLFVLFHCACAQADHLFLKHLSSRQLKREHLSYLSNISSSLVSDDSLNYYKAKYHLQYFNDSLFKIHYLKSRQLIIGDTCSFNLACIEHLDHGSSYFFDSYALADANRSAVSMQHLYRALAHPGVAHVELIPEKLRPGYKKYLKYYKRKPVIAGALSLAVPGLGKLYAGRKKSFLMTFISHAIYGIQSYESVKKLGVGHPFTIFSLSFFGVFYAADVYGSYYEMKQVKKELKKQFLLDAKDHYTLNCACNLY